MKKQIALLLTAAFITISMAGCATVSPAPAAAPAEAAASEGEAASYSDITIKVGHSEAAVSIREDAVQVMAKALEEKTGGAMKVESFPASQLGGLTAMIEQVETDSLDVVICGPSILQNYDPDQNCGVVQLPYLVDTYDQAWKLVDSDVIAKTVEDFPENNMHFLAAWEAGFRNLTNGKKEVKNCDDLAGLKIRVVESTLTTAIWQAFGASPTPMAFSEVYTALQSQVLDGQENPISVIYASNFQEVQKYMTLTKHQYEPVYVVISENKWQSMTEAEQEALMEAVVEAQQFVRQAIVDSEDTWLAELAEGGMEITDDFDVEDFRSRSEGVYEIMKDTYGAELVEEVVALAAEIRG